jgi:hypothetical protein
MTIANGGYSKRAKHISTRKMLVKQFLYDKVSQTEYVASKDNLADLFTKPLPATNRHHLGASGKGECCFSAVHIRNNS